ncbi:MAG: hypothetical protein RBR23_01190 [Arcobacteraceae bacterium]|jgi:hypothetical protein|nr:hypothetical protein [Arcobacteraceae bacterium]
MKNIVFVAICSFFFAGCFGNNIEPLSEKECREAGFTYKKIKKLNYRTGEYETIEKCVEK